MIQTFTNLNFPSEFFLVFICWGTECFSWKRSFLNESYMQMASKIDVIDVICIMEIINLFFELIDVHRTLDIYAFLKFWPHAMWRCGSSIWENILKSKWSIIWRNLMNLLNKKLFQNLEKQNNNWFWLSPSVSFFYFGYKITI